MANQKANQQLTLKKVQVQFEDWRKTRKSRGFIPEALWDAAISLAGPYSLHQISKGLRLNHTALKERVEASRKVTPEEAAPTTFIELPPLNQPLLSEEFSLDLENEAGAKMRIHVKGHMGIDLLALTQIFWSQRQ
jgi:hypothetical protein